MVLHCPMSQAPLTKYRNRGTRLSSARVQI
jgi:hypothetical protein